jgi:hypothetical protein
MSNLVKDLRLLARVGLFDAKLGPLWTEAADEIERLRAFIKDAPEPYEYMTKADFKALPVTMRGFIDAHRNWLHRAETHGVNTPRNGEER